MTKSAFDSETDPKKPPADSADHALPLSFYARVAAAEARRFRQEFTRENVALFFKTMVWVVPLTLLIWVYAEQETEIDSPDVAVTLEVHSNDPGRVVTLIRPAEKVITCVLHGPNSNIERFRDRLSPASPVSILVPISGQVDEISLPTLQTIMENSRFREAGVTVKECTPSALVVLVDELKTREIPVEAPPDALLRLSSATFTPSMVEIRGPDRLLTTLANTGRLKAIADIANLPILKAPGQHPPIPVSLLLPNSTDVSPYSSDSLKLLTTTVQATLTVHEQDVTFTFNDMPVQLQALASIVEKHKIKFDPFVPSVQLVGPTNQIEQIRSGSVHPVAVLEVTEEDVATPDTHTKPLQIRDLPEGVKLAPGANPQMQFVVSDR